MAFQPIVNLDSGTVWGWEALVRGPRGEEAHSVLAKVNAENRYRFDQRCRTRAIELACQLGLQGKLSINFLPNAVYEPRSCMRATIEAAKRVGFPLEQLQFEITEAEEIRDDGHLRRIVEEYRAIGVATAIDDFGRGHAGLSLLTHFKPDTLKLDMGLIRGIDRDRRRQLIVRHLVELAAELPCITIAEGVETLEEARYLAGAGITLQQGYLFAHPGFENLPVPDPGLMARLHPSLRTPG